MRIGGLASGMDTEQMIKDLMRVQRMPVDKLNQKKQSLVWQRDAYRELNTLMTKFRDNTFDTVMMKSVMAAKKVTSSNESLVTATATGAASNGSFTISKVTQLATAATNASITTLSGTEKIDPSKDIQSQQFSNMVFDWKNGKVEKESISVTEPSSTVELAKKGEEFVASDTELLDAMSVKVNGKDYEVVTGVADADLQAGQVLLDRTSGTLDFGDDLAANSKISVTYVTEDTEEKYFTSSLKTYNADGESVKEKFAFQGSQSLNQVMSEINSSSVGVSMFYDSFSDKVSVQRKETGDFNPGDAVDGGAEMNFEGSFFTSVLGLDNGEEKGGDNAVFTINGLDTERHSNTFDINGVTFSLKGEFDATTPVSLNVNTNTDKVFDTVVKFVNDYNELLEKVNGKLTEERYRDYKPLTDEQKEAMSEKDVERWEERAMSGLLRGDNALSSGMNRLRMDMYSSVSTMDPDGNIRQLTDLGITTTKNYMDRGKLEIDESKLRAAIESDPEGVYELFAADGATTDEKGIARRMRDSLQETMRAVSERAGGSFGKLQNHQFTLGRNLNDIEDRISNFERRSKQVEDRYWKQFTAMETAMQQANAQAEQLYNMLSGGQQQ